MSKQITAVLAALMVPMAAQAMPEEPAGTFYLTTPSGLELEARKLGLQFYDPESLGSETPVYQLNANFRAKGFGVEAGTTTARHYKADPAPNGTVDPLSVPAITADTEWLCELTQERVWQAIQTIPTLPEDLLETIKTNEPSFFSVLIEMQITANESEGGSEDGPPPVDSIAVLHDLREGGCKAIDPASLKP